MMVYKCIPFSCFSVRFQHALVIIIITSNSISESDEHTFIPLNLSVAFVTL